METIGFIGIGPINAALARFSVKLGYEAVICNSRGEDSVAGAATAIGCGTRARSVEDCIDESDLLVLGVPLEKYKNVPSSGLKGKILVDTCNYYPQRNGSIPELDDRSMTSSELIQKHFSGATVVKAFYNLDRWHLENGPRPFGSDTRWALPIASDDEAAAALVARWMGMIGFDPVFCGDLKESWRIQAGTSVHIIPYLGFPPANLTKDERRIWYRWDRSQRVTEDDIRRFASQTREDIDPFGKFEDIPSGLLD